MTFHLIDLDPGTRRQMLAEFDLDVSGSTVFSSAVVDPARAADYLTAQRRAFESGTPETLADEFLSSGMLVARQGNGATVNGPAAAARLAAGQFGAYYARAVCAEAIATERRIEVYRARASSNPRPTSDAKVGETPDPGALLNDLRANSTNPAAFSILPEVNSGITIKLV